MHIHSLVITHSNIRLYIIRKIIIIKYKLLDLNIKLVQEEVVVEYLVSNS